MPACPAARRRRREVVDGAAGGRRGEMGGISGRGGQKGHASSFNAIRRWARSRLVACGAARRDACWPKRKAAWQAGAGRQRGADALRGGGEQGRSASCGRQGTGSRHGGGGRGDGAGAGGSADGEGRGPPPGCALCICLRRKRHECDICGSPSDWGIPFRFPHRRRLGAHGRACDTPAELSDAEAARAVAAHGGPCMGPALPQHTHVHEEQQIKAVAKRAGKGTRNAEFRK